MSYYEKTPWRYVILYGLAFLLVISGIVMYDSYVVNNDKAEFCEGKVGVQEYPICERNPHKYCHRVNASVVQIIEC